MGFANLQKPELKEDGDMHQISRKPTLNRLHPGMERARSEICRVKV